MWIPSASEKGDHGPPRPFRVPRLQLMLDQSVQGALLSRVALYWFVAQVSHILAGWCWIAWTAPNSAGRWEIVADRLPAVAGSFLVLPLVLADVLRVSNRFVAPVATLQHALRRISLGDPVTEIACRGGDQWRDLIARFNKLLHSLSAERTPSDKASLTHDGVNRHDACQVDVADIRERSGQTD